MGIFDKKNIDEAAKDAGKKKGSNKFTVGVYTVKISAGEVKQSKKGNWMVILTFSHPEYDDLLDYFVFDPKNTKGALRLVEIMKNAFDYTFEPIEAFTEKEEAEEALKQIQPYFNQDLQIAVKEVEDIFEKNERGRIVMVKFSKPNLWYVGSVKETLKINKARAITPLPEDKLMRWNAYQLTKSQKAQEEQTSHTEDQGVSGSTSTTDESPPPQEDDLPF